MFPVSPKIKRRKEGAADSETPSVREWRRESYLNRTLLKERERESINGESLKMWPVFAS